MINPSPERMTKIALWGFCSASESDGRLVGGLVSEDCESFEAMDAGGKDRLLWKRSNHQTLGW